jgi:membrane-associated phospholipid phosphatase
MSWRTASLIAPVAYAVTLAVVVVTTGLPLEHTQLFFWIVLGLAAVSVRGWRRWWVLGLEWLPLLALLIVYDYLRGAASVPDREAHVATQIDVDRWLGGGEVPTLWLQHRLYDAGQVHWYDIAIWCTYLSHFFTVWLVAAVLWKVAHQRFRRYVALVVALTVMSFMTYWLYPAQPPWLAGELGEIPSVAKIVPTVWDHLGVPVAADLFETGEGLVNLVAAMPSLHAAYPAMLLLFFWADGMRWRIVLGFYTLAMGFALVYGGEHFVADILVGWLYAAVAFGLVCVAWPAWRRRRARRRLTVAGHDDDAGPAEDGAVADRPVSQPLTRG